MDEIELVANYSVLQRARSYAELTRWMGQAMEEKYPGLVVVGTVTADFASVVLDQKEDRDKAAPRLRARQRDIDNIAAARAETGMQLIERRVQNLAEPDDAMLSETLFPSEKDSLRRLQLGSSRHRTRNRPGGYAGESAPLSGGGKRWDLRPAVSRIRTGNRGKPS